MRLTCPNCTAQYQVPADAIPENGRDVQCSACDHTWFQSGEINQAEVAAPAMASPGANVHPADTETPAPEPSMGVTAVAPLSDDLDFERQLTENLGQSKPAQTTDMDAEPVPDPDREMVQNSHTQDVVDDDTVIKPKLPKRELDPQVASVLREEAEREKRARQAAIAQNDQPPEKTVDGPDINVLQDEPATLEHDVSEFEDNTSLAEPKRKKIYPPNLDDLDDLYNQTADTADQAASDTLPDPDELKSSLRDESENITILGASDIAEEAKEKTNRRSGFILAFIVLAAGFWLYSNAAAVAQAIPQSKTALQIFVLSVDAARDGLNNVAIKIVELVSG